jgi:hypothetical protein
MVSSVRVTSLAAAVLHVEGIPDLRIDVVPFPGGISEAGVCCAAPGKNVTD